MPNNSGDYVASKSATEMANTDFRLWDRLVTSRSPISVMILVGFLAFSFTLTHLKVNGTILDHKNFLGQFQYIDKVFHFGAYCVLTFIVLFVYAVPSSELNQQRKSRSRGDRERCGRPIQRLAKRITILCLLVLIYGIIDETSQPWFERQFEVLDLLFNIFGIAAGQIVFVIIEATGWRAKLMSFC